MTENPSPDTHGAKRPTTMNHDAPGAPMPARPRGGTVAVSGKGGTGKTLVAALIIKALKKLVEGPILALDADPDANLATVLGISVEKSIGELRDETLRAIKKLPAGMSKQSYIEAGLHGIIAESEKVDLITMGHGEGPDCYCYLNSILRKFADDLRGSYQWMVMDNEAGLEHLSRRTTANVDFLIVVANNNPLSLDCARRIKALLPELKNAVGEKWLLANNVDEAGAEVVRARANELEMKFAGWLPHDPVVEQAILGGIPLFQLEESDAVQRIEELTATMTGG